MPKIDYTNVQEEPIAEVNKMPSPTTSSKISEMAQEAFASKYGVRPKEIHVSGSRHRTWYLSPKWNDYVKRWPEDKAVFVHVDKKSSIIGWLFFKEVEAVWRPASNNGHDISGPFRAMESFSC